MPFTVTDLGDEIEIKKWDELDIDKELFDEELLAELERLEAEENNNLIDTNQNDAASISSSADEDTSMDSQNTSDSPDASNDSEDKYFINSTTTKNPIESDNENKLKNAGENMNNQENNEEKKVKNPEVIEPQVPKTVNLQIEADGKIINKEMPLPPEYEVGDELIVDVRTDRTPGNSIDEILLSVKKSPENLAKQENIQNIGGKSSDELDKEIKQMEEDIQRLKEENERLRKNNG
jgi:hypothetical protein